MWFKRRKWKSSQGHSSSYTLYFYIGLLQCCGLFLFKIFLKRLFLSLLEFFVVVLFDCFSYCFSCCSYSLINTNLFHIHLFILDFLFFFYLFFCPRLFSFISLLLLFFFPLSFFTRYVNLCFLCYIPQLTLYSDSIFQSEF